MAAISTWVKSIIFLVLFAAFLELLLPNKTMKSFVRVVIGFFILLAILQPIVDFKEFVPRWLEHPLAHIVESRSTKESFAPVQAQREKLIQTTYCKELEKQINVMVQDLPEVAAVKSKIVLKQAADKNVKENQIDSVQIYIKTNLPVGSKIEVNLHDRSIEAELPSALISKVVNRLSNFYQISAEKFSVERWR